MKVLIVGKDAYLATGIKEHFEGFDVDAVARAYEVKNWEKYDAVVNFGIQPEHFSRLLNEDEMIDVQIAKELADHTRFLFMSSRKVYGTDTRLKEYAETDDLEPFDFYSKNKVNIEHELQDMLGDRLLILRISNIVGLPPKKNSPTFVSWLNSELQNRGKVIVTADKNARKDFITRTYLQNTIHALIAKEKHGIFNVGANFAYTTEELLKMLVPEDKLDFQPKEDKGEQFILNCSKLHQLVPALSKKEFKAECFRIKDVIVKNAAVYQATFGRGGR